MDAPSPNSCESSMVNPFPPVYAELSHSIESILARGGRLFLIVSMSSYPLFVSMTTSEPLFHTRPDAPTFDAAR